MIDAVAVPTKKKAAKKAIFECHICHKMFKRKFAMAIHIERVHEGYRPWECTVCNRSFLEKSAVKHHNAAFHEGKNFSTHTPHPNRISEDAKPHRCSFCNVGCGTIKVLKRHVKIFHLAEYPAFIEQINKNSTKHEDIHTVMLVEEEVEEDASTSELTSSQENIPTDLIIKEEDSSVLTSQDETPNVMSNEEEIEEILP
jgi:NAD-dependent SIR2 family protein deacetylase